MFDRLVRRTILTQSDRVMRQYIENWQMHNATQSHRWSHVVSKDKKRCTISPQTRQNHSIERRSHTVLPDAEVHVATAVAIGSEIPLTVEKRHGRWRQVG